MDNKNTIDVNTLIRKCPNCDTLYKYSSKSSFKRALRQNSLCLACIGKRRKILGPFFRNCPKCETQLSYRSQDTLIAAIRKNSLCKSCSQIITKSNQLWSEKMRSIYIHSSSEMKIRRMGMLGKRHKDSTRIKMSESAKKKVLSPNFIGAYGRSISDIERHQISERVKKAWRNPVIREKYYNALMRTKWLKVRTDLRQLEIIAKWNSLGFKLEPNYQFKTKNHLFYLDGYDPIHKVVIEVDGKYHNGRKQQQKDINRQEIIIETLKPKKFWRYNLSTKQWREVTPSNSISSDV